MKKVTSLLAFLSFLSIGFTQQIHSPAEIFKLLSDSKLSYDIKSLNKSIDCKDYSDKLNYNNCYRVSTDSGLITYKFSINEAAKPFFDKAENFFNSKQPDSALYYYKLTLKWDSSQYNVMTYIGQIYDLLKDQKNAIIWYKKAISKNYIDYMAHWFLADDYLEINDRKNAVDEIVIAQILNRNNPRIKRSMISIFNKVKRNTEDWSFCPQMELTKSSDHKISVAITDKWVGYAMAKALWTYEPGYKESMGVTPGQYSTLEDKECLISLLASIENAKVNIKDDAQLLILKDAAEKKHLEDYILYEIVLPQTPFVAFQLPEQTILSIKDYILTVRNKK